MPEVTIPVRGKRISVIGERADKYGKRKPSKVRTDSMPVAGMYSGKELERMVPEFAQLHGVSEDQVRVETYEHGEAPTETNPRHRVENQNWDRPTGDQVREVRADQPTRVRRVFSGMSIPQTPEEWEQHIAAFYARKETPSL